MPVGDYVSGWVVMYDVTVAVVVFMMLLSFIRTDRRRLRYSLSM